MLLRMLMRMLLHIASMHVAHVALRAAQLIRMFVGCGCACFLGAYTLGAYTSHATDFGARNPLTCPLEAE